MFVWLSVMMVTVNMCLVYIAVLAHEKVSENSHIKRATIYKRNSIIVNIPSKLQYRGIGFVPHAIQPG